MTTIFSANTGFLWPGLPFLDRIARAAETGFGAVEFHDEAQREDPDAVARALADAGLPLVGMNVRMGDTSGCAAVPGQEAQARADFDAALAVADRLDARAIHVVAGRTEAADRLDVLARALTEFAGRTDRTLLVEPIAAIPGFAVPHIDDAARVVDRVGAPNVKIMFDTFHIGSMGLDLIRAWDAHRGRIGHVQIAAPGTRLAPGPDDTALRAFLDHARPAFAGCEWKDPDSSATPPAW